MTKNLYGIPFLGFLIIAILSACGSDEAESVMAVEPSTELSGETSDDVTHHPLSIPGLRERSYAAESLTLLDPVPASEGLEAREFSYRSEGLVNYGLIEKPAGDAPEGGWPVIVLAHGYIPPDAYSTVDNYRLVTRYYAAGGFLVVKPDYRGHGRSEGRGGGPTRTIDYSIDVLNLIGGLDAIPDADTDNVFLYGHSMGGEIGLRILTVDDRLRGASLWAAVTEDYPENTLFFIRRRSETEAAALKVLVEAEFDAEDYPSLTPNSYLESIDVPILVHHGTADESVPFEWSVPFRRRLEAAGVDFVFYEYPGEDHNISRSFYSVMDRDMAFFRSLMDG